MRDDLLVQAAVGAIERAASITRENNWRFVRYRFDHNIGDEWVYNEPDIDAAKVVWARDMGPRENEELINYFQDRHVWLVEADERPPKVSPYVEGAR